MVEIPDEVKEAVLGSDNKGALTDSIPTYIPSANEREVDYFVGLFGFTRDSELANATGIIEGTIKNSWRKFGVPRDKKLMLRLLADDFLRKKASQTSEVKQFLDEARKVLTAAQNQSKMAAPPFEVIRAAAKAHVERSKERLGIRDDQNALSVSEGLAKGAHSLFQVYMAAKTAFLWPPKEIY